MSRQLARPGFKATPDYLTDTMHDLQAVPHRFEMTMQMGVEIGGDVEGPDPSRIVGAFDGERQHVRMEPGGPTVGGDEQPSETIVDLSDNALYVHTPGTAEMADELPDLGASTDYLDALAELGDRWGRADLTAIEDELPENWTSQLTQVRLQNLDPDSFVDLVASAESVEELGTAEIQDEQMTGLAATVTAEDLAAARNTQAAQAAQTTSTTASVPVEPEPGSLGDLLANLEYKVEAWIDRDGNIRRLVLDQGEAMEQFMSEGDNPQDTPIPTFTSVISLDFFDYGDESIKVELPDEADTVDITAAVRDMYKAN